MTRAEASVCGISQDTFWMFPVLLRFLLGMSAHALQQQVTGFPEMDEQRWFLLFGIYTRI